MDFIGKNLKKSDCAIVATYNAFIWQGKLANYDKLEKLAKSKVYGYHPERGFPSDKITKFLKKTGLECRTVPQATTMQLEAHLLRGNATLLVYQVPGCAYSHMIAVKSDGKTIELINSEFTWIELVERVCRRDMKVTHLWTVKKGSFA